MKQSISGPKVPFSGHHLVSILWTRRPFLALSSLRASVSKDQGVLFREQNQHVSATGHPGERRDVPCPTVQTFLSIIPQEKKKNQQDIDLSFFGIK